MAVSAGKHHNKVDLDLENTVRKRVNKCGKVRKGVKKLSSEVLYIERLEGDAYTRDTNDNLCPPTGWSPSFSHLFALPLTSSRSRSVFDIFLGRFSSRNWHWTTSMATGTRYSRAELEESHPGMGLTSLQVEREPSSECLKFSHLLSLSLSCSNFLYFPRIFSS